MNDQELKDLELTEEELGKVNGGFGLNSTVYKGEPIDQDDLVFDSDTTPQASYLLNRKKPYGRKGKKDRKKNNNNNSAPSDLFSI